MKLAIFIDDLQLVIVNRNYLHKLGLDFRLALFNIGQARTNI